MNPRPHVSAAIVQLRLWVWMAAAVLVLSATTELLVFGFVHYTDVRWTVLEGRGADRVPAEVVRAVAPKDLARPAATDPAAPKPADVNRVPTAADRTMALAIQLASTAGVIAALWLMALSLLGVIVGAGCSVPGIERSVTAGAWSIVLALLCLPLKDILPSLPWRGIFGSYAEMTGASEAVRASAAASVGGMGAVGGVGIVQLLVTYVGMPLTVVVGGVFVAVWFRTGVERGMILTTAQQIDEALERELATVRARGIATKAPRAMSALTRTIGEPAGVPSDETRMAVGAENLSMSQNESGGRWRIGAPVAGSPEKRPI